MFVAAGALLAFSTSPASAQRSLLARIHAADPRSTAVSRISRNASGDINITGTWDCCGAGGAGAQDWDITDSNGSLSGTGDVPGGGVFATITGHVSAGAVTIVTTYNSFAPGYIADFDGTISDDGLTITGTWSSNRDQSGTFTATRHETPFTVSGTVSESSSGKGVPGVRVRAACPGGGVTSTDSSGAYSFSLDPSIDRGQCVISVLGHHGDKADPDKRVVEVTSDVSNVDFSVECMIDETILDFKLTGTCPAGDDLDAGATEVKLTPPSGIALDDFEGNGQNPDPWLLPLKDADHLDQLYEPVELPDLDLPDGVRLVGCSLDASGFTADQASFSFGPVTGLAEDLSFSQDDRSATVGSLELELPGFAIEADGASLQDGTFRADAFTLGLPGALGGGSLSGTGLVVGPDGVREAKFSTGKFTIGDLEVDIRQAGFQNNTLVLGAREVRTARISRRRATRSEQPEVRH